MTASRRVQVSAERDQLAADKAALGEELRATRDSRDQIQVPDDPPATHTHPQAHAYVHAHAHAPETRRPGCVPAPEDPVP